jgi:hypothetical protein
MGMMYQAVGQMQDDYPIWPGVSPPGKALRKQQPEGGASMQAAAQNAEGIRVLVRC